MADNTQAEKITIHPSIVALLIQFVTYAIPLFLICLLSAFISRSQNIIHIAVIRYQIFCIILLLNQIRLYYNQLLVLDDKTVTFFSGRISLNYKKVSLAYKDIKESSVKQNIVGRVLNYGGVSFASAGTGKEEIVCGNIDTPKRISVHVQNKIAELNANSAKKTSPKVKISNK